MDIVKSKNYMLDLKILTENTKKAITTYTKGNNIYKVYIYKNIIGISVINTKSEYFDIEIFNIKGV